MENGSSDTGNRGFFFGALQKISSPAGTVSAVPAKAETPLTPQPTTPGGGISSPAGPFTAPKPIQDIAVKDNAMGTKNVTGGVTGCNAQKMSYRQCLELNPDDKVNCTWALDNYLKCTENSK